MPVNARPTPPKVSNFEPQSNTLTIRIHPELKQLVGELAEREDRTVTMLVSRALRSYLRRAAKRTALATKINAGEAVHGQKKRKATR